jgi:hypothetical protein
MIRAADPCRRVRVLTLTTTARIVISLGDKRATREWTSVLHKQAWRNWAFASLPIPLGRSAPFVTTWYPDSQVNPSSFTAWNRRPRRCQCHRSAAMWFTKKESSCCGNGLPLWTAMRSQPAIRSHRPNRKSEKYRVVPRKNPRPEVIMKAARVVSKRYLWQESLTIFTPVTVK